MSKLILSSTSWGIALVALWAVFMSAGVEPTAPASGSGYGIGQSVRDFNLKNVDGKTLSLASLPDATKGAIVIFSCNHCPFVIKTEDRMIALDKKFRAKGFPVVAINSNDAVTHPDDSYPKMQERSKEKSFPFAYLYDESQVVAKNFGAERTPHVYVLQREGANFKVAYIGAIDDNVDSEEKVTKRYVEDAVQALLANKPVAVTTTKAVGCGVKWKKENKK